ncbi:hypothetical protein [Streptomyces rimosus]|uniref:hypothetical protein n=1 Tax=Streptomyces rimosus TaxID=1927 RepID=UPI0004C6B891|nr:hypothetical protein [Streptomyces rimosus]
MTTLITGSKHDTKPETKTEAKTDTESSADPKPAQGKTPFGQADGMAVAAFVLGLVGTLVANVILGPCALVLGALALARHTTRRARAMLGMALGAADLIILATLATADGSLSWTFGG